MTREQTIEAIRVMQAYVDGKEVECKYWYGWVRIDQPNWNWDDLDYRIKPTKTLRPWTKDEVPLGAWLRSKENGWRALIFEVRRDGQMEINNSSITPYSALRYCEHSTDGGKTWKPCGVEEESK